MYLFERVPGIAPRISVITLCINQLGAKKDRALSSDRARKSQNTLFRSSRVPRTEMSSLCF